MEPTINPAINSIWDSITDFGVITTSTTEAMFFFYFPVTLLVGYLTYRGYGLSIKGVSLVVTYSLITFVTPLMAYLILGAVAQPLATLTYKIIVLLALYYGLIYLGWGLLYIMRSITDKMYMDGELRNVGRQMYLGEKAEKWANNSNRSWDDE